MGQAGAIFWAFLLDFPDLYWHGRDYSCRLLCSVLVSCLAILADSARFLVLLSSINLIAVRVFGETEFWFAMIKIVAILALIATAVFMVLTGFETHVGHASLANIVDHFHYFRMGS